MQNTELQKYQEKIINSDFVISEILGDITKNNFLNKLSFLENQLFNSKTKNLINNYQTWLLIYLKKLFYDAVNQNYKFLQKDYKKFILKIYDFFELNKNKNILTSEMYKLFEESLNNISEFEIAKNFSENYYSKISWEEFLNKSIQDSEFNQGYFNNCHIPWNIEILEQKNSDNEFILNIYADNEILLNLADLVINKILTQDIFYKITFRVNFYNSREKDFDYLKILNGNKPLINIITSQYESLIFNLFNKYATCRFLNFLNVEEIFDCIEKNSIGYDPMVHSLFRIHLIPIKDYCDNLKIKMLYVKKPNLSFDEFIKDYNAIMFFVYTDSKLDYGIFRNDDFKNSCRVLFGDHSFRQIIFSDARKIIINRDNLIDIFNSQLFLLDALVSDDYEIHGIYSNDLR